ncbi:MAG: alpha/beta hydrolase [Burkholderiaceae bacterium]|nr:alpha/beta hydrolase [Burkholderiaceae bacterium]
MSPHIHAGTVRTRSRLQIATKELCVTALLLCLVLLAACTQTHAAKVDIGALDIGNDIKLRRMLVRNPNAKGVVLFLHGFPETLWIWKDIATTLGDEFEVHAFDWPGYGLSSRPPVDRFSYSPRDYARVLKAYIDKSDIDTSKLVIYSTDIGALPALLLALDQPDIARTIVVGDFAPFNRPEYMYPGLQSLKSMPAAEATRVYMNRTMDEILDNAFRRGLPRHSQFDLPRALREDLSRGWSQATMTSADAFYHYYSHFTRDQNYFEANLSRLKTPVKVIWGERDIYIKPDMGIELASRTRSDLLVLPGVGHYPHLQVPKQTIEEVRALFVR